MCPNSTFLISGALPYHGLGSRVQCIFMTSSVFLSFGCLYSRPLRSLNPHDALVSRTRTAILLKTELMRLLVLCFETIFTL